MNETKHTPGPLRIERDGDNSLELYPEHRGYRLAYVDLSPNTGSEGPELNAAYDAEMVANFNLFAAASDHALLLACITAGVARIEPLGSLVEVCVGGLRHCTSLDANGCPVMTGGLRAALGYVLESEAPNA